MNCPCHLGACLRGCPDLASEMTQEMETSSLHGHMDQREDAWEPGQVLAVVTHLGARWGKWQMVTCISTITADI